MLRATGRLHWSIARVGLPRAAADCGRTEPPPGALALFTIDSEEIRVVIFMDSEEIRVRLTLNFEEIRVRLTLDFEEIRVRT